MEFNNNALNIYDLINEDPDIATALNMTKLMTKGQVVSADIDALQYQIPNNIHMFDNPLDAIKENIVKEIAKGTLKGAQNLNNGVKNTIQSTKNIMQSKPMQNFKDKLNNDLNLPKKWQDAFQKPSYGEIEITKPTSKYQGYTNPLSKDNRIFTREDIGDFSTQEYADAEPMIMAQWGKIGIPTNGDLEHERLTNNGTVFVQGYTRSDGTKVKSYYRAA